MSEIKLTRAQQAVVENRGGALLVSAAAGSGKTKVLVDRLLSYIEDAEDPANIDEFLIITYTKAAAGELRGKISAEISRRLAERPENRHLQRQLTRIHLAQISTVHAFCAAMLRRYCALRDLPPDFRVAEQTQSDAIRQEVFRDTLEAFYQDRAARPEFSAMADQLGFGRDDRKLVDLFFSCYDEVRCRRDPEAWMRRAEEAYAAGTPAGQTPWGAYWMEQMQDALRYAEENLQKAIALSQRDEKLEAKYVPHLTGNLELVQAFSRQKTWNGVYENKISGFGRIPQIRVCADEQAKLHAQKLRTDALEAIRDVQSVFYADEAQVAEDLQCTAPAIRGLLQLLREFDKAFTEEKRRRKLLDFSDLEHEMIALLYNKDGTPSRAAREIADGFREILVDEYQDSNEVQEYIFEAVSKAGKNRFLVGDVKQSIYRFRLADPGIFLKKYESYADYAAAQDGAPRKILLSDNFRSRKEVLAAANDVFSLCMQGGRLELRYGEAEKLRAGLSYPETDTPKVELHCIDMKQAAADDEKSPDKRDVEAEFVAGRIREMLDSGMMVTDGGVLRRVEPRDIVILMRSLGENAPSYQKALAKKQIASQCDRGSDLFDTTEAQVLLAALKVIDNPHRDVELVTVLGSPVFDVSSEELARARTKLRSGDYYECLLALDARGEKLDAFLAWLEQMRRQARVLPLEELFELVMRTTGMEDVFSAMDGGEARRENLQLLRVQIASFAAAGNQSLTGFLRYMDEQQQAGNLPAAGAKTRGDAVQLMTIHQSKGLEFPVVFLADLSREINKNDTALSVLFDETLLIGANVVDTAQRSYFPSIAHLSIAEKIKRQTIAEELRVLYVAMTRAKEVLVMSYCSGKLLGSLKKWNEALTLPLPDRTAGKALCLGDWVLMAALCRTEAGELFAQTGPNDVSRVQEFPWVIRLHQASQVQKSVLPAQQKNEDEPQEEKPAPELMAEPYAYLAASKTPSKLTATALKGRLLDLEISEQTPQETKNPERFRLPAFGEKTLSGRARGSATHLFMQFASYESCRTKDGVRQELERLTAEKFLTPEQAKSVETGKILRLFTSAFGERILRATTCRREFKFSILTDAGDYVKQARGEKIMLQGVVDCFWIEDGGIVLVDFKTDKTPYGPEERAAHYAPQLEAYAKALARIYDMPVKEKILYFFACDCAYHLD